MSHLQTIPVLEVLRPPPGWRTDQALISTYSADPAVLVALLLALAGRDDDGGSGTRVALSLAFLELKKRVNFIVQRGRLSAPRHPTPVLKILDRFVHQIPFDERGNKGKSWHPKLALVRMVTEADEKMPAQWRLWLGSRNFTRDTSWDICLSLESASPGTKKTQPIPGIDAMARQLANKSKCQRAWGPLIQELSQIEWRVPPGLKVNKVSLMLPGDGKRGFPAEPPRIKRLTAVSPFLSGGGVKELGGWNAKEKRLLSTQSSLLPLAGQQSAPLNGFDLLTMGGAPEDNASPPEDDDMNQDAAIESRSLHAKFIWVERTGGAKLWLGSPNLSDRGWSKNAEAFAEIDVALRGRSEAAKRLYDGLEYFISNGRDIDLENLASLDADDADEDVLEDARKHVSVALEGRQYRDRNGCTRVEPIDGPPHPENSAIELHIARLGEKQDFCLWPRGETSLALPDRDGGFESALVVVKLSLDDKSLAWTQYIQIDASLISKRDEPLLAHYLGATGILKMVKEILDGGIVNDGDGPWDGKPGERFGKGNGPIPIDAVIPTVENVLRTSIREPERLQLVDRMLRKVKFLKTVDTDDDIRTREHLREFMQSWRILHAELVKVESDGD